MTDRCKNITFPQLRLRAVNIYIVAFYSAEKTFGNLDDFTVIIDLWCRKGVATHKRATRIMPKNGKNTASGREIM